MGTGAPPVILLMGPTATGKTDLAVTLHECLPVDIVSVDSAMVYKGMDIGTAKPDAETLARAPHRLIDFLDPAEAYSAARFRDDAMREIRAIHAAGRMPLLVGGTMLYFRVLQAGLADLPAADPALRQRLEERAAREGWAALHAELERLDSAAAARIHPNDPQRIQRALEVRLLTGRSLSELQAGQTSETDFDFIKLALMPADRARLHRRIEQRFRAMMAGGFLDEVRALRARGDLDPSLPALRAVGYRQLWEHLEGRRGLEEAVERGIVATRQFAKRQLTWLRSEQAVHALVADDSGLAARAAALIRERAH